MKDRLHVKPCPVCGGMAVLEPAEEYGFAYVICGKCLHSTDVKRYLTDREAADAWNAETSVPVQMEFAF